MPSSGAARDSALDIVGKMVSFLMGKHALLIDNRPYSQYIY